MNFILYFIKLTDAWFDRKYDMIQKLGILYATAIYLLLFAFIAWEILCGKHSRITISYHLRNFLKKKRIEDKMKACERNEHL